MIKLWLSLSCLSTVFVLVAGRPAAAVVLVSDDFSSASSGVGWEIGNAWEGLISGAVSSNPTGAANVQSFRNFSTPVDASNGLTYIRITYTQAVPGTGASWGGLAFFEGVEGSPGDETFFLGNPEVAFNNYGIDAKVPDAIYDSRFAVDAEAHTLIAEIDTTGVDHTYKIWVDNFNKSVPSGSGVIVGGGPIDAAWGTLRLGSNDQNTDIYDDLTIATASDDVGLVSVDATLTINRATGATSLSSGTPLTGLIGYTLKSAAGTFAPAAWTTVTANYDAPTGGGNGSVDSNDDWSVLSSTTKNLAEFTFDTTPGDGGILGTTPVNLGQIWSRSPIEDIVGTLILDDNGSPLPLNVKVVYQGAPVAQGDLNGDGTINQADWTLFKSGQGAVDDTLSPLQAYRLGDMNGDFDHDLADFGLFVDAYEGLNGSGSFATMLQSVPEPSSLLLLGLAACAPLLRPARAHAALLMLVVAATVSFSSSTAQAIVFASDDFSAEGSGTGWAPGDNWGNVVGGVADTQVLNGAFRDFATPVEPYLSDKFYLAFDYQTTAGNQWGGLAFFTGSTGTGAETLFIGDPGQYSAYGLDLKQGQTLPATGGQGIPIDTQSHRLILEIDWDDDGVAPFNDKYSLWVDSINPSAPTHTVTIQNSPITAPWQSLRLQSAGNGEFFKVDNLIMTDEASLVFAAQLDLLVDKTTGLVTLRNPTNAAIDLSAYSIESDAGMLNAGAPAGDYNGNGNVDAADYTAWRDGLGTTYTQADYNVWRDNYGAVDVPGGWTSLADQNLAAFPKGNGSGNGWEEGAHPSNLELEEYFLTGESVVAAGASVSLGTAYLGGASGAEDLAFRYWSNGELKLGSVTYANGAGTSLTVPEPHALLLGVIGAVAFVTRRADRAAA